MHQTILKQQVIRSNKKQRILPRRRGAQNALQERYATPASEEEQRENAVHVVVLLRHRQVVA